MNKNLNIYLQNKIIKLFEIAFLFKIQINFLDI